MTQNEEDHLGENGAFVVEAAVPDDFCALPGDQYVAIERIDATSLTLGIAKFDRVTQILDERHVTFAGNGIRIAAMVIATSGQANWTSWPAR